MTSRGRTKKNGLNRVVSYCRIKMQKWADMIYSTCMCIASYPPNGDLSRLCTTC